jgi:hypothetical protein
VPDSADIRAADARTLAQEFLRQAPDSGRLSTGQATDLLGCYGILLACGEDTRVSRLADDRPEITRLDLSPVIAGPGGAIVMAARITVAPCEPHDPFLQKLR